MKAPGTTTPVAARGGPCRVGAWRNGPRTLILLAWLVGLAGCASLELGKSGRGAELARQHAGESVVLLKAEEKRAVFEVRGRAVIIEPPEGYCLDADSAITTRRLGFVLVADCLQSPAESIFPGILTVSVSGEPIDGTGSDLDDLEALLESERGRRLLGRSPSHRPGAIVATRRIGGALYVLVEEKPDGKARILQPRFWRAFVTIHDRLALVTVSGFADRPVAEDAMLAFTAAEVARLRRANGLPPDPEEDEIAAAAPGRRGRSTNGRAVPVEASITPLTAVPQPRARPSRGTPAASRSMRVERQRDLMSAPLPPPRPG